MEEAKNIKHTLDKIRKILYNKVKKPYYYVGPCPECGSFETGRFIKYKDVTNTEWMINEALRNGELIEPLPEVTFHNCFCNACGIVWHEEIELKMATLQEIKNQKELRDTNFVLKKRYEEARKELKKKPFLFRFYGKI